MLLRVLCKKRHGRVWRVWHAWHQNGPSFCFGVFLLRTLYATRSSEATFTVASVPLSLQSLAPRLYWQPASEASPWPVARYGCAEAVSITHPSLIHVDHPHARCSPPSPGWRSDRFIPDRALATTLYTNLYLYNHPGTHTSLAHTHIHRCTHTVVNERPLAMERARALAPMFQHTLPFRSLRGQRLIRRGG